MSHVPSLILGNVRYVHSPVGPGLTLPKMGALVEDLLECDFFIPLSKFKMRAYLEGLLELL
jgi:hypothetical protein